MLKKLKARKRRAKIKQVLKDHASEVIVGALVGLVADIVTDVARKALEKKVGGKLAKKFR